jgi:hypothetical protein
MRLDLGSVAKRLLAVCGVVTMVILGLSAPAGATSGAGTISGVVTNAASTALPGVNVSAYSADNQPDGASTTTASDGTYSMTVSADTYYVSFSLSGYATQYWKDAPNQSKATSIIVSAGGTYVGIDAQLIQDGTVTGLVSGRAGTPLSGVSITAQSTDQSYYGNTTTAANGNYLLNLAPDTYSVCFSATDYVEQCVTATVTSGNQTTENVQLVQDGTVTGTVTGAGGTPLSGVQIQAQSTDNLYFGNTTTAANGNYTLTLAPDTYSLCFNATDYVYQCVTPTVTSGNQTTESVQLVQDGTITGTVTTSSGTPLPGATVTLESQPFGGGYLATAGAGGAYTAQVPPGTYLVSFFDTGYATQLWKDAANFNTATPVIVSAGSTVAGIDAALVLDGKVTGRVVNLAGTAIAGASVQLEPTDGSFSTSGTTGTHGVFNMSIAPGSYNVVFSAPGYASAYWKNTQDQFMETPITVKSSTTTSGISATLAPPGVISGRVAGPGGTPLPGATVYLRWPGTGTSFENVQTNYLGQYSATVPSGSFLVRFVAEGYVEQYYSGASTAQTATLVGVSPGQTVSSVNATLACPLSTQCPNRPTVTSISPKSGPVAGGTTVTVKGTNFTSGSVVYFGSYQATNVVVGSGGTSLSAVSPAYPIKRRVDVTVTTPAGTSPAVSADGFSYS